MNIDFVFKIAAIGIIVAVLNQLLIRSGREEQAMMTTLAGLIVVPVSYTHLDVYKRQSHTCTAVCRLFTASMLFACWESWNPRISSMS